MLAGYTRPLDGPCIVPAWFIPSSNEDTCLSDKTQMSRRCVFCSDKLEVCVRKLHLASLTLWPASWSILLCIVLNEVQQMLYHSHWMYMLCISFYSLIRILKQAVLVKINIDSVFICILICTYDWPNFLNPIHILVLKLEYISKRITCSFKTDYGILNSYA